MVTESNKEPRPQGGALKPKFSKPKTEIPKSKILKQVQDLVRDDKKTRTKPSCHAELVSASGLLLSAFSRHTFHPRTQDGVFRCAFNKKERGFIIILVACALSIVLISLSIALPGRIRGLETSREFETRKELERIRAAIMGLPNEEFAFISDMGRLPNNLEELNTQGMQPSFHASDGGTPHHGSVGMGWRGSYYRYGTTNDDYLKDAWGRPYIYVITESVETAGGMTLNQRTARIISKGPDGIYPSSDDIYSEEIFQRANLILRVVKVFKDDIVQNVEVTVYSSSNGEQTSVTSEPVTFPGVEGTEYAIPFYDLHHGVHSFKINFGAMEETGYLHLIGGFANRYTIAIPVGPGGKGGGT